MDKHIAENLERACRSILVNTRNELYLKMRFLDVALSSFIYIMDWDIYRRTWGDCTGRTGLW